MRLSFTLLLHLFLLNISAQKQYGANWIFGDNQEHNEIDSMFGGTRLSFLDSSLEISAFDIGPYYKLDASNTSMSDKYGNLLFYCNGKAIRDAHGETITNGDGLDAGEYVGTYPGSIVNYGTVAIPKPGSSDSIFYIFHNGVSDPVYLEDDQLHVFSDRLYSTTVELLDDGSLIALDKNKAEVDHWMPRGNILPIRHANGRDWWLFAPKYRTNLFYKILVDPNGVSVIDSLNRGPAIVNPNLFYPCLSKDGETMVRYSAERYNGRWFEVYDVDRCEGDFHLVDSIYIPENSLGSGIALSPSGQFAYITRLDSIFQYDIWADDIAASRVTVAVYDGFTAPFPTTFWQPRLAPDDKIYINSNNGTNFLHVIEYPDRKGLACEVCQHCIELPTYNSLSIPENANYSLGTIIGSPCDSLPRPPLAEFDYTTAGAAVSFYDSSTLEINTYLWSFGDGNTDTIENPVHLYESSGEYEVCLTVSNDLGTDQKCRQLSIIVSSLQQAYLDASDWLLVYPNPAYEQISLKKLDSKLNLQGVKITCIDALGRAVKTLESEWADNEIQLDVSAFPPGMYTLVLHAEERLWRQQVVVK